ncbi:MAG: methyltransferase type 12 [uncultured bacterium]|uniref:Methyltransferase type 12 n=1 Tax=Candidatus Wolfebacteria bacterium GW2011_GWE2_44_13 TaxID=1619017 RepID=A0A0G1H809_9BACT|nr:MAG: methyltransferase type 12 [uncultured bacterium]KKT43536.1 MAG: Methyltransferase type 12 [Candidatus Wolfebacteria bacterium GW2011_GWE2_44_13]
MKKVAEHFDAIAATYDFYKQKNWYYYDQLKALYASLIPMGKRVLEIGCGTGDLIATLRPALGVGIDISQGMIDVATKKHESSGLSFYTGDTALFVEQFKKDDFEYIFLSDVIEHLEDSASMVTAIGGIAHNKTKIIVSMANPLWEPILLLLEKLKLKMPEGPHYRMSGKMLEALFAKNGLAVAKKGQRNIFPAYIPYVSNFLNNNFYKIPGINKLGLVMFWVFEKRAN